jgi:hypothetical protein
METVMSNEAVAVPSPGSGYGSLGKLMTNKVRKILGRFKPCLRLRKVRWVIKDGVYLIANFKSSLTFDI